MSKFVNPETMPPSHGTVEPFKSRVPRSPIGWEYGFDGKDGKPPTPYFGPTTKQEPSPMQGPKYDPMQKFGNAMDTFDSYMNQGGEYLGQGLGALMRPVNSLIGGVMNPVGSILETAMSPINSIMGGLASSPIGQMAGGFGKGVANYTSPEPQMDLSRLSPQQMAELMELLENQIASRGETP